MTICVKKLTGGGLDVLQGGPADVLDSRRLFLLKSSLRSVLGPKEFGIVPSAKSEIVRNNDGESVKNALRS